MRSSFPVMCMLGLTGCSALSDFRFTFADASARDSGTQVSDGGDAGDAGNTDAATDDAGNTDAATDDAGATDSGGIDSGACGPMQMLCSTGCVDIMSDRTNCGGCSIACAANESCSGACQALNDTMRTSIALTLDVGETTVTGSTLHATPSAAMEPSTVNSCQDVSSSNNVWYSLTLPSTELVYADTRAAGTSFDTVLYFADSSGTPLPLTSTAIACGDDSCGGITSTIAMSMTAGTYYIVVAGYREAVGNFTLHVQHMSYVVGTNYTYTYALISGSSAASNLIIGTPRTTPSCAAVRTGEDAYWFTSCGTDTTTLSFCPADGGVWQRAEGTNLAAHDPVMAVFSGSTGAETACDDNAPVTFLCPASYMGSAGDGANLGSRISQTLPRGLNIVTISDIDTGSSMHYTLAYSIH